MIGCAKKFRIHKLQSKHFRTTIEFIHDPLLTRLKSPPGVSKGEEISHKFSRWNYNRKSGSSLDGLGTAKRPFRLWVGVCESWFVGPFSSLTYRVVCNYFVGFASQARAMGRGHLWRFPWLLFLSGRGRKAREWSDLWPSLTTGPCHWSSSPFTTVSFMKTLFVVLGIYHQTLQIHGPWNSPAKVDYYGGGGGRAHMAWEGAVLSLFVTKEIWKKMRGREMNWYNIW